MNVKICTCYRDRAPSPVPVGGIEYERRAAAEVVSQFERGELRQLASRESRQDDQYLTVLKNEDDFKMSIEPEGWHMDASPPSWDAEAKTFSFFLQKPGHERVLCIQAMDALEKAAQSSDLSRPAVARIFDAHRQLIELRAAQKLKRWTARIRWLRAGRR